MQKILSQLNQLKAKPDAEDINLKFLRALPSSWSQLALNLKSKGGLEFLSFDDLYYKLKTFKVDVKGYITFSSSQSTGPSHSAFVSATSTSKKMLYGDSLNYSSTTTYSVPSNFKTGSYRSGNVIEDILQSFVADTKPEQQLRVLQRNQLTLEDKIRVLSIELENTPNLLKHSERINADFKTAKKDLQTKLDNHLVQTKNWRNSSKNLFKLIDSSMSVRTKVGLGFTNCISKNELGCDDSAFSVFTTNSEDVAGRPIFHRFAKTNSMKVVPSPLSRDYTSLSDHIDLDES
nr:ribonuclease H-like domain-containing protein [Tanacetum cinerariifolium]